MSKVYTITSVAHKPGKMSKDDRRIIRKIIVRLLTPTVATGLLIMVASTQGKRTPAVK